MVSLNRISLTMALPYKVPEIEYYSDKLPWHKTACWEDRPLESIKRIIVHHMASDAPLYNQAKYHVDQHGWPGLSYHLVISEGRIRQINDLLKVTYHAAGNNQDSVGIAIHGDLSKREITAQERELLYAAILTVKEICPIEEVLGHNEVNPTACPCTSMNRIREDLAKLELQMKAASSPEKVREKCYKAANQHLYLFNEYQRDPEGNKWLEPWLLHLHDVMKEKGMFFD